MNPSQVVTLASFDRNSDIIFTSALMPVNYLGPFIFWNYFFFFLEFLFSLACYIPSTDTHFPSDRLNNFWWNVRFEVPVMHFYLYSL